MPNFQSFPKIPHFKTLHCNITQKIHGTNAAVVIYHPTVKTPTGSTIYTEVGTDRPQLHIKAQSRTRFITPHDDNYGFASWVEKNKEALISALGIGVHYGEWSGPGINSGEGLKERTFVLFDFWRYKDVTLPPNVVLVPLLYTGPFSHEIVSNVFDTLKREGSVLSPGFMRPEGIVVTVAGQRFKMPFDSEEVAWKTGDGAKVVTTRVELPDVIKYLQPIRLEKLLSRDERYVREFPNTLPEICMEYMADMESEGQLKGVDKATLKAIGGQLFKFVKQTILKGA